MKTTLPASCVALSALFLAVPLDAATNAKVLFRSSDPSGSENTLKSVLAGAATITTSSSEQVELVYPDSTSVVFGPGSIATITATASSWVGYKVGSRNDPRQRVSS